MITYRTAKHNRRDGEPYWVVRYGPDDPLAFGATICGPDTREKSDFETDSQTLSANIRPHYMFETQEQAACIAHALNHAFRRGKEAMRVEMWALLEAEG